MVQDSSASCAAVTCYERRKIKFVLPASMHITQVQRELPENQGDAMQLDNKLEALRDYVSAHLDDLATVSSRSLKAVFARQRNSTERSFYKFLWSSAKRFTEAQRSHGDATLALAPSREQRRWIHCCQNCSRKAETCTSTEQWSPPVIFQQQSEKTSSHLTATNSNASTATKRLLRRLDHRQQPIQAV